MSWIETIRTGLEAIVTHRLRSALTILGILIGIAAVILTVGFGEGAQAQVAGEVSALGSNLLIVTPGSTTSTTGVRGGFGTASTLTMANATALSSKTVAPDIKAVAPTTTSSEELTYSTTNWTSSVVGTNPDWLSVRNETLAEGRFIVDSDVTNHAAVVVLGSETAEELFGIRDPIGDTVNVGTAPMTVIGVLNSVGSSSTTDEDDQAIVPITTAADRLVGGTSRNTVSQILLEATSQGTLSAAYQEADYELLALHNITNPTAADFTITSQVQLADTANSVNKTLTIFLGGVAGISLLDGHPAYRRFRVTERVREIGLRKALGATPRIIRRQFLAEASFLGLVGGVLGVGLGLIGAAVIPHLVSNPIAISAAATIGSIVVAVGIGIVAGVYPASRAARLAPIDALRSE